MISVIIPHLDQEQDLKRCLASLSCQGRPTGSYELIVVDNGSRLPPAALCAAFGARLLCEPTPGPGPARNLGVASAGGEILAFIDADCIAAPDWLGRIEAFFADHPQVDVIGGDVRVGRVDPDRPTWLEAYESVFAYRMKEYIRKQGFTGTGNLAMRRPVFDAVGPFGGIEIAEDRDWGQRALRRGFRTHYCAAMIAWHPARKSFSEIARKWQRHIAHDLEAARARPAWRLRWLARALAVAASPLAEIPRIATSDRIDGARARFLAFSGCCLIRVYRAGLMSALAFGSGAPRLVARWNRA